MRGYNLNPEPPFNPDLNSLWNQQYLKPFLEHFNGYVTLLPLDACHSQRDGTRCELVDLQTSSGRNRQRKQCFQMLKGPPSRTWLALPFTHNTMGRVVSLSICYVTFMDYNVPKRTNTLDPWDARDNGTIIFCLLLTKNELEKKKKKEKSSSD